MSILEMVYVAAGGAVGSLLRFLLALASSKLFGGSSIPGTLAANLVGCFAIGILLAATTNYPQVLSPRTIVGLRVGLLGGLTTFSTFAAESILLANQGKTVVMAAYVAASVIVGIAAVWAGMAVIPGRSS